MRTLILAIINALALTNISAYEPQDVVIESNLFSVYELSDNTISIVSNMDEGYGEPTVFDDIFYELDTQELFMIGYFNALYENKIPENISYRDTTGIFRLVHNKRVEDRFKPLINKEYYIYGTKGMESHQVDDVCFVLDECKTNFFSFSVKDFDKNRYGYPLIASDKKLDMVYGENYENIESKINDYYDNIETDFRDNIPVKVFANLDRFYFSYNDDFNWNKKIKKDDPKCLFPDRAVFYLHDDGEVELIWYDGLDLYGIPCD